MSRDQSKRERVPKRVIHTKKRKNLSDSELTRDQINLLSRGLKFISMPKFVVVNVNTGANFIKFPPKFCASKCNISIVALYEMGKLSIETAVIGILHKKTTNF